MFVNRVSLGTVRLEADHSVSIPAHKPLVLELVDGDGKPVFIMSEEHQVSPGEYITPGVPRKLFNGVCGGCHGSLTGNELDIACVFRLIWVPVPAGPGQGFRRTWARNRSEATRSFRIGAKRRV